MRYIIKKKVIAELIDTKTGKVIKQSQSAEGLELLYDQRRVLQLHDFVNEDQHIFNSDAGRC